MFPVTAMPMPGALRLRAVHPLIEGDGSCGLIYDLERGAVVEVPEELQFHIAPALEMGDLDESVLGWLANEDLLTSEGGAGWTTLTEGNALELTGAWSAGAIYRVDDELHVRIEHAREDAALEIIGCVLQQSGGNGRVKIHLSWSGSFPERSVLERIVAEASRQAGRLRQEVAFELTLDAREVTPAVADVLAGLAVQVRLLCGSYPARTGELYADVHAPAWKAEAAVCLLLEHLGERLSVHCVLDQGRLLDVWEWAKRTGVRHLDATVQEDSAVGDGSGCPGRLRETRNDMMAVCDETADALAAQTLPVDFKPLTRIVDRLMRSEPLDRLYGESSGFGGLMPVADVYPRSFLDRLDIRPAPGPWDEVDTEEAAGDPCQGCWARHVCSHSTYVASSLDGEDLREPSEERCGLWRTEVEVALRFYHRLAHADPLQVRRFFEDSSHEPGPTLIRREDLDHLRMPF
ncbi:MAG TPA: hypothetical protein VF173_25935 [Thermoanaerobaculia bacterium]|nr:hypothetical protein [Thermoanaerobaculia bacterium]